MRLMGWVSAVALAALLVGPLSVQNVSAEPLDECVQATITTLCRSGSEFVPCDDKSLFTAQEVRFQVSVDTPSHVYFLLKLPGGAFTVIKAQVPAGQHMVPAHGSFLTEAGEAAASRMVAFPEEVPDLAALSGKPSDGIPEAFLTAAVRFAQCGPTPAAMPAAPSKSGGAIRGLGAPGGGLFEDSDSESLDEMGGEGAPPPEGEDKALFEPSIER